MRKRGRPPYPDILTPREWEVLALLREGLSNEQIAQRLNITRRAARYHVSEILSKLGVDSRQEAACWEREEARPLWLGALTFALWPLRHLPFGLATKATATVAVVGAAGGMVVLAWGVYVTGPGLPPCDLEDFECVQPIAQEVVDNAGCDFNDPACVQHTGEELARILGCGLSDADCLNVVWAGMIETGKIPDSWDVVLKPPPTPQPSPDLYDAMLLPYDTERDAGVMKILGQNKAVAAITAGRELGRDYWIRMSYVYEDASADNSGPYPIDMVDIYFDPPVSYSGEIPVTSDACDRIADPAEDDPCQDAPREYRGETKYWTFADVQKITAEVHLEQGVVVDVFYFGPPGDWSLGTIKSKYAELFPNGVPVHKESELIDGLTHQFRNRWWP